MLPASPPTISRKLGISDEHFTTASLAPLVLKPVTTPLDLLQSRTLKHTFRNPHIEALAKTALDLGETEADVGKCVGSLWAALEEDEDLIIGPKRRASPSSSKVDGTGSAVNGSGRRGAGGSSRKRSRTGFSPGALGAAGASSSRSMDELNPIFSNLEDIFITREDGGLRVSMPVQEGDAEAADVSAEQQSTVAEGSNAVKAATETQESEPSDVPMADGDGQVDAVNGQAAEQTGGSPAPAAAAATAPSMLLTPANQRDILLASMSCLQELEADSSEYLERLQEIRSRLTEVARRRDQVWRAIKLWSVRQVEAQLGVEDGDAEEEEERTTSKRR